MPSRGPWAVIAVALLLVSSATPPPPEAPIELSRVSSAGPHALGGAGSDGDGLDEAGRLAGTLRVWNAKLGPVRSERIARAVLRCRSEQGLAPEVVLAVMKTESTVRPSARSPKGAVGLMQVMPHMFAQLGLPGPLGHLETNVEAGCMLLADNIRRLGVEKGISSYFWGNDIRGVAYLHKVRAAQLQVRQSHIAGPAVTAVAG